MSAPASLAACAPASALPELWRPSVSRTIRLAWPVALSRGGIGGRAGGERLVDHRLLAEGDHAVAVAALHGLAGIGHEAVGPLARGQADVVGRGGQEHDVPPIDPTRKRRPD